jgi:hypothetical protein
MLCEHLYVMKERMPQVEHITYMKEVFRIRLDLYLITDPDPGKVNNQKVFNLPYRQHIFSMTPKMSRSGSNP